MYTIYVAKCIALVIANCLDNVMDCCMMHHIGQVLPTRLQRPRKGEGIESLPCSVDSVECVDYRESPAFNIAIFTNNISGENLQGILPI